MGDEMLTLFYDKEILNYTKAAEGKNISEYDKEAEFRLFRDYFGLIHLIQSCEVGAETQQRGYGDMLGYTTERNRLDSVDSDIWSDTSSGGRDFDTSLDGVQPISGIPQTSPSLAPGFSPSRNIILRDGADTALRGRPVLADVSKIAVGRRNQNVCVFCRNNGESKKVYSSHVLKDSQGNTVCPILRAYTCPLCKASGDESHTIKYCPKNKNNRLDK